jgi:Domain of unknown function (DUF4395)
MNRPQYGVMLPASTADGKQLRAPVFNEIEVRAAAGLTMAMGAVAFVYSFFAKVYLPIQSVTAFFFVDFLLRVTVGLDRSPIGIVARAITRRQPPQWVSAKPKRFAWSLGMVMSFAMAIITNWGIRGALPATICLTCLTLMWMESVLGLCLGCEMHAYLVRRGWTTKDDAYEVCAGGVCDIPSARATADLVGSRAG